MSQDPDEDLIEATIRRVAASKAARLPDADDASHDASSNGGAGVPDLHLVSDSADAVRAPAAARPAADESLIEATLRRIEAQQAARAAEAADDVSADVEETAPAREPVPDIHLVRGDEDERIRESSPRPALSGAGRTNLAREPKIEFADAPPESSAAAEIAGLRRDLDETRHQLRQLSARVDAILASASEPTQAIARPSKTASPAKQTDDDWEDAPVIARVDTGLPPRPAIIRDPAPAPTAKVKEPPAPPRAEAAPQSSPTVVDDAPRKGFDLLPRTYRITVEDKRRGVDLVPLHRALLGMEGVRDMSLLSYSNGTAIVALEATTELSPDALGAAVAHAMARETKVEVHNEQTMVVKLAED